MVVTHSTDHALTLHFVTLTRWEGLGAATKALWIRGRGREAEKLENGQGQGRK